MPELMQGGWGHCLSFGVSFLQQTNSQQIFSNKQFLHLLIQQKCSNKKFTEQKIAHVQGVLIRISSLVVFSCNYRGNVSAPGARGRAPSIFCDPCPTGGLLPLICLATLYGFAPWPPGHQQMF